MSKTRKRYEHQFFDDDKEDKHAKARHLKHLINDKHFDEELDFDEEFDYKSDVEYFMKKWK